ncbi:HTH-type transcriptional regulator CatM [Anaerotignum neopropionicum]|uniref:HTH-type transcriptional regulator CatM n=1 Tax=Anaerotignum neopropionicum TaxID=36847 RepID=A0A136WG95_9FIRM|nr:LysR family transcriptional regulator [Anaerotignum neopropionicum]KXL53423.1 HTH-type transcriptional regulator CatM [Anaerotignum neopropionicum]
MNLTDLKYVIEIDKCGSISLAAKKLYVAQSNLSRAVKELEQEFDIVIFKRTPKGVITTREGQRFLRHAKEIQYQINILTNQYSDVNDRGVSLKISVPRASYISEVFTNCLNTLIKEENMRIHYCETNSSRTIQNVLDYHYDIGIIRYNVMHEGYYLSLFKLKDLAYRLILEFDYLLLTSKNSIIADKYIRADADLEGCIEVVHGDERLPSGDYIDLTENDREERYQKKVIYVYERGSQFEILSSVPNTYMWVSPVPEETLEKYGLVQMRCGAYAKYMKDVLIFKENHVPKKYEKLLIDMLREKTREFGCYL